MKMLASRVTLKPHHFLCKGWLSGVISTGRLVTGNRNIFDCTSLATDGGE